MRSVAYSPDSSQIVSDTGREILVWDAQTGQESSRTPLEGHTHQVLAVSYSPDGTRIVSSGGKTVRIWDADSGSCIVELEGHTDMVSTVAYSPMAAGLPLALMTTQFGSGMLRRVILFVVQ